MIRPMKFRGGIGGMPHPNGADPSAAAHDYHHECGVHTHEHDICDPHHHFPPHWDHPVPPENDYPPTYATDDGIEYMAGNGIGGCSTGSCGVGALPDGTIVQKPRGMTRAGFRKFMKRLGKGRSMTSLTAKRVARGMGIVGTWRG